ncbi:MAG TPA: lysoplasmalogenase [Chitinophagales bacterium]|nr:lysoplasmalogenase [Chitinophagales bacterium]
MSSKSTSPKHFIFYFLLATIHLVVILWGYKVELVSMISKSLLMPALMVVFYRLTRRRETAQLKFVFAALAFSWVGDVSLMFQQSNSSFFLIGLICFLLAHVAYIIAFIHDGRSLKDRDRSLLARKPWIILFFIAYAIVIFFVVRNGLGNMLLPVLVYMSIILLMGMSALNRFGKIYLRSFNEVFCGALLFIMSDSLLAINKFSVAIPSASFLIMLTYVAAQYFIVKGMIDEAAAVTQSR